VKSLKQVLAGAGALACLVIGFLGFSASASEFKESAKGALSRQCAAISGADFSSTIDAPTHLRRAIVVPQTQGVPAHCRVEASISPMIQFELHLLPSADWNGKLLVTFDAPCGGYIRRGYACMPLYRNGGKHVTDQEDVARHLKAGLKDWTDAQRSTHLVTVAAKAIVERYYVKGIAKSYFMGCSAGGYEGFAEAQRFPWDFNGLVAGELTPYPVDWTVGNAWTARSLLGRDGKSILSAANLGALHRAVLAACDANDGLEDGIISDPLSCRVDLSALSCHAGENECLSPSQLDAIKRVYSGPRTSAGVRITAFHLVPGSELGWSGIEKFLDGASFDSGFYGSHPPLTPQNFDLDKDYNRIGLAAQFSLSPDFRTFARAGGKLIAYQGGNDSAQTAAGMVDYYGEIEKIAGGNAAARDFVRLFVIPGMNHCANGEGAYAIDYLSYLEAWVERGFAPDRMLGAHINSDYFGSLPVNPQTLADRSFGVTGQLSPVLADYIKAIDLRFPLDRAIPVDFVRPVFPYPAIAKYRGTGDPKDAASFEPVLPEPRADGIP
jgi:hypothetical protein